MVHIDRVVCLAGASGQHVAHAPGLGALGRARGWRGIPLDICWPCKLHLHRTAPVGLNLAVDTRAWAARAPQNAVEILQKAVEMVQKCCRNGSAFCRNDYVF